MADYTIKGLEGVETNPDGTRKPTPQERKEIVSQTVAPRKSQADAAREWAAVRQEQIEALRNPPKFAFGEDKPIGRAVEKAIHWTGDTLGNAWNNFSTEQGLTAAELNARPDTLNVLFGDVDDKRKLLFESLRRAAQEGKPADPSTQSAWDNLLKNGQY